MKQKLALIRKLQSDYPELVLGGSIGLFLHGLHLRTPQQYKKADLDFTSAKDITIIGANGNDDIFGSPDMPIKWTESDGTKCDCQVDEDVQSIIICHEGWEYKVCTFMHMVRHKYRYAKMGVEKHIADMRMIDACLTMPVVSMDEEENNYPNISF